MRQALGAQGFDFVNRFGTEAGLREEARGFLAAGARLGCGARGLGASGS
jgi:hypothetical protein